MPTAADLLGDSWLRGCAAAGVVMGLVTAIAEVPWPLWFAWAYVVLLSTYGAARTPVPGSADRDLPERPDAVG